jgi:hypothetical protein
MGRPRRNVSRRGQQDGSGTARGSAATIARHGGDPDMQRSLLGPTPYVGGCFEYKTFEARWDASTTKRKRSIASAYMKLKRPS